MNRQARLFTFFNTHFELINWRKRMFETGCRIYHGFAS